MELPVSKPERMVSNFGPIGAGAFAGRSQAGFPGLLGGPGGLAAIAAAAGGIAARLGTDPKFAKVREFSPAMLKGSAEAVETILRSKYGGAKDPVAKNTKDAADVLKRIEQKWDKPPGRDAWDFRGMKLIEIV
ncbi:hypothetical protein [Paludisphaera soli]|uniref:hypothetical protein n=1 Tax=Paludisphaera soli TaxID=2712865 RepID=UPI0013EADAC7|nr:hypothetical protein [Paludisphaera soli]